MHDRLLKPEELADRLGISLDWVYRHWKTQLPFAVKFGKHLRFSERGLQQYIEENMNARTRLQEEQGVVD